MEEEPPHARGQGRWLGGPTPCRGCAGTGGPGGAIPHSRSKGVAAGRSYPMLEARGGGREDQPHVQGAVAVRAQENLEELSHVEGQEGRNMTQMRLFTK